METVKRVKSLWMVFGGIAFLIGDYFGAKGTNWFNYIDNVAILSMIILGANFLKWPQRTNKWFDKGLLVPVFLLNISLVFVSYNHPGHTFNAISGMLLVLAMLTHHENTSAWILRFFYLSYSIIVLYNISQENIHYQLLETDPQAFFTQKYVNYIFFSAAVLFIIQVSAAKGKEFKRIRNSFELVKEYDVKLLNAILHNIKAPAGIISARLDIAKLSEDKKLTADSIDASVEIMNSQLKQIKAFTEVINAQHEISLKEISLRLKKLTLNRVSPTIVGNENHAISESIFFALESILNNAMNHSRLSKIRIKEASGVVSITIKDKGPGIAPEIFEKIGFELIEKPESFGISLLLGRFILKRSQWFIEVGSKFKEGSSITISNHPIENQAEQFDLYKNI